MWVIQEAAFVWLFMDGICRKTDSLDFLEVLKENIDNYFMPDTTTTMPQGKVFNFSEIIFV